MCMTASVCIAICVYVSVCMHACVCTAVWCTCASVYMSVSMLVCAAVCACVCTHVGVMSGEGLSEEVTFGLNQNKTSKGRYRESPRPRDRQAWRH